MEDFLGIEKLIDKMHRGHVLRVRSGEIEIELHPSAFLAPEAPLGPAPRDPDRCECTHSFSVEHNGLGCLKGCSESICARSGEPEAQA